MARKVGIRDNFNRFQKYATINITKQLEKTAQDLEVNLTKVIEDKLLETYKTNVQQSYSPRTVGGMMDKLFNEQAKEAEQKDKEQGINARHRRKKLTYRHTGLFLDSIYTKVDDKTVKIMIADNQYPDGTSTTKVHKYLTQGTEGGGYYSYQSENGETYARNYPTPKHEFEEYTQLQMMGFLDSLEGDIKNGKYNSRRYKLKKRR